MVDIKNISDINLNQIEYCYLSGDQNIDSDSFKIKIPKLMTNLADEIDNIINKDIFSNASDCRPVANNVKLQSFITVKKSKQCKLYPKNKDITTIPDKTRVICNCINNNIKNMVIVDCDSEDCVSENPTIITEDLNDIINNNIDTTSFVTHNILESELEKKQDCLKIECTSLPKEETEDANITVPSALLVATYLEEKAPSDHDHNISDLSGVLPIEKGGTGTTDINKLKENLGTDKLDEILTTIETINPDTGEVIETKYVVSVEHGGTGADNAVDILKNLTVLNENGGIQIGDGAQSHDGIAIGSNAVCGNVYSYELTKVDNITNTLVVDNEISSQNIENIKIKYFDSDENTYIEKDIEFTVNGDNITFGSDLNEYYQYNDCEIKIETSSTGSVQLGEGNNINNNTLQFRDTQIVDENGYINSDNLKTIPIEKLTELVDIKEIKDPVTGKVIETKYVVPIEKGGTSGSTLEEAQKNLGIDKLNELITVIEIKDPVTGEVIETKSVVSVEKGGTGVTSIEELKETLGVDKIEDMPESFFTSIEEMNPDTDKTETKTVVSVEHGGTGISASSLSDLQSKLGISNKQDKLTFDITPTKDSTNPVTSHGIYIALEKKAPLNHEHSASDIKSGTLSTDRLPVIPIEKGGTGATSLEELKETLGVDKIEDMPESFFTPIEVTNPDTGETDTKYVVSVEHGGTGTSNLEELKAKLGIDEINELISELPKFDITVVDELPDKNSEDSNISSETIYLLKSGDENGNIFEEYIFINNEWELLGTQKIDLTNYVTKDALEFALKSIKDEIVKDATASASGLMSKEDKAKLDKIPDSLFTTIESINPETGETETKTVVSVEHGGTGADNAVDILKNLTILNENGGIQIGDGSKSHDGVAIGSNAVCGNTYSYDLTKVDNIKNTLVVDNEISSQNIENIKIKYFDSEENTYIEKDIEFTVNGDNISFSDNLNEYYQYNDCEIEIETSSTGSVQLGEGNNINNNTLQFRDTQIVDENGYINSDNLKTIPIEKLTELVTPVEVKNPDTGEVIETKYVVPIEKGGTGGSTLEEAQENLGIDKLNELVTPIEVKDSDGKVIETKYVVSVEHGGTGISASSLSDLQSKLGISNKQDKLTFDTSPTKDSSNPVTSGGIYTSLSNKAPLNHGHSASEIESGSLSTDRLPVIPIEKGGTGANNTEDALMNLTIVSSENGGASVGYGSKVNNSGAALGVFSVANSGGAVGYMAQTGSGGAVGYMTKTGSGGAVGDDAFSTTGGSIGYSTYTESGGAVGYRAESGLGFAGGHSSFVGVKNENGGITSYGQGGAVGNYATTNSGGAVGSGAESTKGGAVGLNAQESNGGFAGGNKANATTGGAIGKNAAETDGGFAGGEESEVISTTHVDNTFTGTGGAIGKNAKSSSGGAVGENAYSAGSGFAGGYNAKVNHAFTIDIDESVINLYATGGAIGENANTSSGGAVGANAESGTGFAGGENSSANTGGAVGKDAKSIYGGFAGGENAYTSSYGAAVGLNAKTAAGGAVGSLAKSGNGFAGGNYAVCGNTYTNYLLSDIDKTTNSITVNDEISSQNIDKIDFKYIDDNDSTEKNITLVFSKKKNVITFSDFEPDKYTNGSFVIETTSSGSVQLGKGNNPYNNTLQFRNTQIVDSNGKINSTNLNTVPVENGGTGVTSLKELKEQLEALSNLPTIPDENPDDVGSSNMEQYLTKSSIEAGDNINIVISEENGTEKITISAQDTTYSDATTSNSGLMSSADKTKLDKITYYVSKVNGKSGDVTLTYTDVGALPNTTVIPTKVSELTNDKGYLTDHQSLADYALKTDLDDKQDKLTFDTTPTASSTNPVTSDGIYNALSGKASSSHNHSASDIKSGTLSTDILPVIPIDKGGTGTTSIEELKESLGISGDNDVIEYVHPTYTARTSDLYKITVDNQGHVSAATAVQKSDITALGIPGQDTVYSDATTSNSGLMSSADKTKLAGIETGANKTTVDSSLSSSSTNPVQNKVINTALSNKVDKDGNKVLSTNDYTTTEKNKLSGIAAGAEVNQNAFSTMKVDTYTINATSKTDTFSIIGRNNVELSIDASNRVVIDAKDTTYSDATTSNSGLMSSADKTKLDKITSYVSKVNGKSGEVSLTYTDVGALPNTTIIPTVPTNVSAFTNDAGYLTDHQSLADYALKTDLDDKQDKLTFDTTPTASSTNPVTSNGVYAALKKKASSSHNHPASHINSGTLSTDRLPVIPIEKGGTNANNTTDALKNLSIINSNGGIQIGGELTENTNTLATTTYGVALGRYSRSTYGGAVGNNANSVLGGAVGSGAKTESGGAIGYNALSENGFAGGMSAQCGKVYTNYNMTNINKSNNTMTINDEIASQTVYRITLDYESLDGDGHILNTDLEFTQDKNIITLTNITEYLNMGIDESTTKFYIYTVSKGSVQLGEGNNPYNRTLQFRNTQIVDSDGKINSDNLKTVPVEKGGTGVTSIEELKESLGISEDNDIVEYTHPSHTSRTSDLYKITVDNQGHVSGATKVTKADITALGIPGQDTTYSNATTSNSGLMSSNDKSKLDGIEIGANKTVVDTTLNSTSTNPVQNKVIYTALENKSPLIHNHSASDINSGTLSSDYLPVIPITKGGTGISASSLSDLQSELGIPVGAEVNQNAFSNVNIDGSIINATSKTDTFSIIGRDNIELSIDGNNRVIIDAKDTVYTHPSYTAKTSGLYKITVDEEGHVEAATAVQKSDITALGIPGEEMIVDNILNSSSTNPVQNQTLVMALSNKAPLTHKHSASDINSGELSSDYLPVIPVEKGGTGANNTEDALKNLTIVNETGGVKLGSNAYATSGGAIGNNAETSSGGAVGNEAYSGSGFAGGKQSYTQDGGAVGQNAKSANGFAGGYNAIVGKKDRNGNYTYSSGGAIGSSANSDSGGAVGHKAYTQDGGAVGASAKSKNGFAGGTGAICGNVYSNYYLSDLNKTNNTLTISDEISEQNIIKITLNYVNPDTNNTRTVQLSYTNNSNIITFTNITEYLNMGIDENTAYFNIETLSSNSVQLGQGYNPYNNTLQFRDTQIVDSNGKINSDNLKTVPITKGGTGISASSLSDLQSELGIPVGAEVNQNAFSNVNIDGSIINATSKTDTFSIIGRDNIELSIDGNNRVIIDAKDTVYTHPSYTAKTSGLYKITVDEEGHVEAATAVQKSDITALGIPGEEMIVDNILNSSSTNPVQNQTLVMALGTKSPLIHNHSASDITSGALPVAYGGTGANNTEDALKNLSIVNSYGGIQIGGTGDKSASTVWGVALAEGAKSIQGAALGLNAYTESGGSVGQNSKSATGFAGGLNAIVGKKDRNGNYTYSSGGAIGSSATTETGGSVGTKSTSTMGGAIGNGAYTETGGAIGATARSLNGFAGGFQAICGGIYSDYYLSDLNKTNNTLTVNNEITNQFIKEISLKYEDPNTNNTKTVQLSYTKSSNIITFTNITEYLNIGIDEDTAYFNIETLSSYSVQLGQGRNVKTKTLQFRDHRLVDSDYTVYGTSFQPSQGSADFAEWKEWLDGNPNNEDRRGYFVTSVGKKIRIASSDDDYILGVVSSQTISAFIANASPTNWHNKWLKDVYGDYIMEEKIIESYTDENGVYHPEEKIMDRVLNPEYDETKEYISRSERKEYVPICFIGQIVVNDDGTCEVDKYCTVNKDGIATLGSKDDINKYRVQERIDDSHVLITFR